MKKYLVVNNGSASKKYALYSESGEIAFLHLETEEGNYISTLRADGKSETVKISVKDYEKSLDYLIATLKNKNLLSGKEEISGVGIRVVAPGIYFQQNRIIDKGYVKNLKVAQKKAPLHLEVMMAELAKLQKFFGKKMNIVGISDSEFFSEMPFKAKNYGIDIKDAEKFGIYRYGYHGISAGSIVHKLKEKNELPEKLVICHIGGGISVIAVKNGRGIETSMGFTPLEGVVMANRVGDIDSGAVIYLSEVLKLKGIKLLQYLNKKCGLLGLSGGISNDIRDLLKAEEEQNNISAKNTLDTYAYRIQKQIGSCFVALGGIDAIVFSGTVGERSYKMRKRICDGLLPLGIKLDYKKSESCDAVDCEIGEIDSKVKIKVVKTDEMSQIAREIQKII